MLELEPPEFAHLPFIANEKGKELVKEPTLSNLRSKKFLPEAIINGVALLGWNPPHREDPGIISAPVNVFMKHEVLTPKDIQATVTPELVISIVQP